MSFVGFKRRVQTHPRLVVTRQILQQIKEQLRSIPSDGAQLHTRRSSLSIQSKFRTTCDDAFEIIPDTHAAHASPVNRPLLTLGDAIEMIDLQPSPIRTGASGTNPEILTACAQTQRSSRRPATSEEADTPPEQTAETGQRCRLAEFGAETRQETVVSWRSVWARSGYTD